MDSNLIKQTKFEYTTLRHYEGNQLLIETDQWNWI